MEIVRCTLTLHEPLFFATREAGRLYETGRCLHNYALAYAFGLVRAPYFVGEQVPRYAEDLAVAREQGWYVTPALPLAVRFHLATFKYGEEFSHVEMVPGRFNTPSFGRAKELAPESTFRCYVLSEDPGILERLPRWIRLGKWHSKVLVEIEPVKVEQDSGDYVAACPLNPLDVPADTTLHVFDIISMPPSSLVLNARCSGAHYVVGDGLGIPAGLCYTFSQAQQAARPKRAGRKKSAP